MTDSTTTTHEDRIIASDTMPALTVTFEALWLGREQVGYVVLSGLPLFVTSDEAELISQYRRIVKHFQSQVAINSVTQNGVAS